MTVSDITEARPRIFIDDVEITARNFTLGGDDAERCWLDIETDEALPADGMHCIRIELPRGPTYEGYGEPTRKEGGRPYFVLARRWRKVSDSNARGACAPASG